MTTVLQNQSWLEINSVEHFGGLTVNLLEDYGF